MSELINRAKTNVVVLRQKREKLFEAFDIYKTNFSVGLEKPTEYQWKKIVEWYEDLKDLKPSAFEDENIPSAIKYYIN